MNDNLSAFNSGDYDSRVGSVIPYYSEFHKQVIDLVMALDLDEFSWLDTGCGTGSLIQDAYYCFDKVSFTLCDPSAQMLSVAQTKTGNMHNYYNIPTEKMAFDNEFDVVTAIQAHHYLDEETRKIATQRCYKALTDGGVYICFENIEPSTNESFRISEQRWRQFLQSNGKNGEEIESHLYSRGIPITIEEHIALLRECGFRSVDILWASYMQAGFFAIK